jgi:hypothetical protein
MPWEFGEYGVERKNGVATYILNRYINLNICILVPACAFAAKKRDAHAFERSIDDIVATVEESLASASPSPHGRRFHPP